MNDSRHSGEEGQPSRDTVLPAGSTLSHYRLLDAVGAGGMATVYLAEDLRHERKVAVKVLRPELAAALGQERFLREITTTANLRHPHILPLYDSGRTEAGPEGGEGALFYVMPYVEGESLRDRLDREKQLPVDEALRITGEVAEALDYAHGQGVVHRDIKPENILLEGGHAVVADFGIAWAIDATGGERLTGTGLAVGTPAYMSPEQAARETEVDGRSDIYALGCVLYEMLAGRPPFTGPTVESVVRQHIAVDAPSVTTIRPSVPASAEAALARTLAKAPADRFRTATEFSLAARTTSMEIRRASDSSPNPTGDERAPGRRRAAVAGGAVLLVGAAAAAAWWVIRPSLPDGGSLLESSRVVVAPFENATGQADFDALGGMAADWITEGISRLGNFEVVPAAAVLGAGGGGGGDRPEPVTLARLTGAGIVVGGRYYLGDGRVHLQAQLLDGGTGRILRPVDGVSASPDSVMDGISGIRRNVLSALSPIADTSSHLRTAIAPPNYEAYREYIQAMEAFVRGDLDEAVAGWNRAIALDPSHPMARVGLAISLHNLGRHEEADTVLAPVLTRRSELGPMESGTLDLALGMLRGDRALAREGMLRAARVAPGTIAEFQVGQIARWSNQPEEAIRVLEGMEPERGELTGFQAYWWELGFAHLMRGDPAAALEVVREGRTRHPGSEIMFRGEVEVLAALGRSTEVEALLRGEHETSTTITGPSFGSLMRSGAWYLADTDPAGARDLLARSLAWYEALPSNEAAQPGYRLGKALVLMDLDELARARELLSGLLPAGASIGSGPPIPASEVAAFGLLGRIAAMEGREEEARAISERLGGVRRRQGLTGIVDPNWGFRYQRRAEISAALGEPDEAVDRLRRAHDAGVHAHPWWRVDPALRPLHGHPAFEAFMRPRG